MTNAKELDSGMSSIVYRVKNIITNKGYLCLKVLKKAFLKKDENNKPKKERNKKQFWDDDDDIKNEHEEEAELNFTEIKRLYTEYQILNNLQHPNIVKVYGFYYGDKYHNPSILLEYCKSNLVKAIEFLENADLIVIIYEICSVMKYVHAKKIIHRDLKMNNILINSKKHVNICDFGISKVMDETTMTSMTHGIGTIMFMAPEMLDSEGRITEKVDVYAFGVILYFIVTKGKYPKYSGPGRYENIRLPSTINKLSRNIIKRCWSNFPENRPSFNEIINLIVQNNFILIDGIDDEVPQIRQQLGLD